MIKCFSIFLMLLCSVSFGAHKKVHKIAIIDTGLDLQDPRFKSHLCKNGHKDFTGEGLYDSNGHGTFVAGLIQKYAGNGNYCLLIYKYYTTRSIEGKTINAEIDALSKAIEEGAEIVNFSGGGADFSEPERDVIKNNPQVKFVVSAGNNSQNLDSGVDKFYPASYTLPNIEVIGSLDQKGELATFSNYSYKSNFIALPGSSITSYAVGQGYAVDSGTSYSTAIRTGLIIRKLTDVTK